MSELCYDCFKEVFDMYEEREKAILSINKRFCEECMEYKRTVIRVRKRCKIKRFFSKIKQKHNIL